MVDIFKIEIYYFIFIIQKKINFKFILYQNILINIKFTRPELKLITLNIT